MRRFQLSDGSSHKFWQIEIAERSFTVTFGRIGTAGQTQLKSFDTAEKATREYEKLVNEKIKKGYAEASVVGVTATVASKSVVGVAATVASKPEPAATQDRLATASPNSDTSTRSVATHEVVPVAMSAVALSDAALRAASPIRGIGTVPARAPDARALHAKLAKALLGCEKFLDAGEKRADADKVRMQAARAAFTTTRPSGPLELEAQAAAYALFGAQVSWNDNDRQDDFVRYWLAVEGASFALHAFASGSKLRCVVEPEKAVFLITEDAPMKAPWFRERGGRAWRGLRLVAVLADEKDQAALLKEAESIAMSASPAVRGALAAGFERPAWCDEDLVSLGPTKPPEAWVWPLLAAMRSVEDAEKLIAKVQRHTEHLYHAMGHLRFDLVTRYGVSAAGVLLRLGAPTADALALIMTPEVATYFVRHLGTKEIRAIAAEYLQSHGELSLGPLAEAAVGRGATAEPAKAVLKHVLAQRNTALEGQIGSLSSAAQHLIGSLREQGRARDDATDDELPRVLRDPPWTRKVATSAPDPLLLTMLSMEEAIEWRRGERETLAKGVTILLDRVKDQPEAVSQLVATVRKVSDSKPAVGEESWQRYNGYVLAQLPKKELLGLIPTLNLSRFNFSCTDTIQLLVAYYGLELLDLALRFREFDVLAAVEALRRARSPRVAPLMADAFVRFKKAKTLAQEWLLTFPDAAATGLVPDAVGKPGKAREAAEITLRFLASRGHRAAIEAAATQYGSNAAEATRAILDFDPQMTFPTKIPRLPSFWNAGAFTRPLLKGGKKALPLSAIDTLGVMLAFSNFEDPYAGLVEVNEACEARSLADFAWDLFQAWLVAGASAKEQWAMLSLAYFGDDDTARKLTPLVRAWPGEAAHARAVIGLDVLARIGTDVALMHLHGIAQKLKFKGLQERAREKIAQIADARGLTADELADRLVPDLGLDDDGSLGLDFGPRRFRVVFDESLKPAVMDEMDKRLPDLPKPKQTDDPDKSKEATERWKALKKDARTIASGQILRLEVAMCSQRRWTGEVFNRFMLEHPLLSHLVRRLLWGTYESGHVASTFRVAEDRSLADVNDKSLEVAATAEVGLVHRIELDDQEANEWGRVFADYEILQPFAQLSREVCVLAEAEKQGETLERVVGLKLPTGKVLGLDMRGWRRGPPQDAGVVCWYEKPLGGKLLACLDLDPGIFTGIVSEAPEQTLGAVTVTGGNRQWHVERRSALSFLSPIALSELLRDLDSLRG